MPEAALILVVEDNEPTRQLVVANLEQAGYRVNATADGRDALDHLAADPRPDVVLLDMLMPVLDGWHFLERLGPHQVPVVVMTATCLCREWAEAHDCQGFLPKPV